MSAAAPSGTSWWSASRTASLIDALAEAGSVWSPSLSPDAARVAYVDDRDGLPRLAVAPTSGEREGRAVSPPGQEVVSVSWSPSGQWLAYLVSPSGSLRSELHVVRPDGADAHRVFGGGTTGAVFGGGWTSTGEYAFSLADDGIGGARLMIADVVSNDVRELAAGGFLSMTSVSRGGQWLLARRGPRGARHLVLIDIPTGQQRPLVVPPPGGPPPDGEDGRFTYDFDQVLLRTSVGREFTGLAAVSLTPEGEPGDLTWLAVREGADLDSYAVRPDGRTAVLVWNVGGRSEIEIRDLKAGVTIGTVTSPQDVVVGWALTPDGSAMVINATGPCRPRALWWCDLPTVDAASTGPAGTVRPIDVSPPSEQERAALAHTVRPTRESYHGLDGLPLEGWLFRPRGDGGEPGRTVITFHGGPESQERPAWSSTIQSLVAAGLTVFAPNVRGSSGYGRTFVTLDDVHGRESAVQDVVATVRHLVDAGIADPARIGAHGWSYGGYLTLTALTRWPELFAAGCSAAGMSDLCTFFATTEPWVAAAAVTKYGHPEHDGELLRSLSPMSRIERLTAPTLFVHGDQDTNVPVAESLQAYRAVRERGVQTALMLLGDEGHTIVRHDGRVRLAQGVTAWFERWL